MQLFLQASSVKSRDQTAVSSEPFVRTLRMTRYMFAEQVYIWHVFMTYQNVSTLVRISQTFLWFFTARRYASAVYSVVTRPSVCLSVRPFVRLFVTSRHCTKMAKRRITILRYRQFNLKMLIRATFWVFFRSLFLDGGINETHKMYIYGS